MALIKCPECQQNLSDTVTKCIHCGAKLAKCPECGTVLVANSQFCSNCGYEINTNSNETNGSTTANSQKSKVEAVSDDKDTLMDVLSVYIKKIDKNARIIDALCSGIITVLSFGLCAILVFIGIMDVSVTALVFFILPLFLYSNISGIIRSTILYNKSKQWNWDIGLTLEAVRSEYPKNGKVDKRKKSSLEVTVMENTWFIIQHKYDTVSSVIFDIILIAVTVLSTLIGGIICALSFENIINLSGDFDIQEIIIPIIGLIISYIIFAVPIYIMKGIEKHRRINLLNKLKNSDLKSENSYNTNNEYANGKTTADSIQLLHLSKKINTVAIIYLIVGIIQVISIIFLIIGIINIVIAAKNFKYSKEILTSPKGIVNHFEPLGGAIALLICNILFGGIIGIIGSIYYLTAVRGFVMENKDCFNAFDRR